MTLDEAKAVARVVETAEGGCGGCVNEAARQLNDVFADFDWKPIAVEGFHASIDVTWRAGREPIQLPRRTC